MRLAHPLEFFCLSVMLRGNMKKSHYSPWLIWGAAEFFTLFQFLIQLTSGVIVEPLMHDFNINAFDAAMIISGFYCMYIALQIPAGILMDKIGPRLLLSCGAFVCSIGCIIFSQTHLFYVAFLSRLCMGTGAAFAFVGTLYVIREWFPISRYSFLLGMSEMLGMTWAIVGILVFTAFLHSYGWRMCLMTCGFFFLASSLVCALCISNHNPTRTTVKHTGISVTLWQRFRIVIRSPLAWMNGIYSGLMFSVVTVFVALWEPPFLQTVLHISIEKAATIDTMAFVGIALGCPLFGFVSQRFQQRRLFLIISGFVTSLLFAYVIYFPPTSFIIMSIFTFLIGLSCSGYILSFAISDEISLNKVKNTYTGFTNAVCVVMAPLLQPLVGYILDAGLTTHQHYALIDYQHGLTVILIALIVGTIIAWFMPETFKKNQDLM
jgi:MFS family permease